MPVRRARSGAARLLQVPQTPPGGGRPRNYISQAAGPGPPPPSPPAPHSAAPHGAEGAAQSGAGGGGGGGGARVRPAAGACRSPGRPVSSWPCSRASGKGQRASGSAKPQGR
ncbi:uncharacterized protein ACIBXB_019017 [Morphnus guianensis]